MTTPAARSYDLVGHLLRLIDREDRGALAALRRGLGKDPGEAPEMFHIVEPHVADDASNARRQAAYLVASLFALHQQHRDMGGPWSRRGFGSSLRAARFRENGEADPGIERRFEALLDCRREELPTHLRHLATLLHARNPEATIDYRQLLIDIEQWDHPDRRVQRDWATGFWGYRDSSGATDGDDPDAGTSDDNSNNDDEDNQS